MRAPSLLEVSTTSVDTGRVNGAMFALAGWAFGIFRSDAELNLGRRASGGTIGAWPIAGSPPRRSRNPESEYALEVTTAAQVYGSRRAQS